MRKLFAPAMAVLLVQITSGCAQLGYYTQAVQGHFAVLAGAKPIDRWLDDPAVGDDLKTRLKRVRAIRSFAARELALPENGSYTKYADVRRKFVMWNVVATPELSLTPERWCFPVAGCVDYRGYYSREAAQTFADKMNVALIGISATNSRGPRSFSWAVNIDEDYKRVEAGLIEAGERVTIAKGKLIAMGFSQGGQLAVEIAVRHPDEFAGAIALSAGSRSQLEGLKPSEMLKKRGFVVSVNGGENPGSVKLTAHDADWLRAADAKLIHKVYPDVTTHSIPADFEERFPEWVKFVLEAGK